MGDSLKTPIRQRVNFNSNFGSAHWYKIIDHFIKESNIFMLSQMVKLLHLYRLKMELRIVPKVGMGKMGDNLGDGET